MEKKTVVLMALVGLMFGSGTAVAMHTKKKGLIQKKQDLTPSPVKKLLARTDMNQGFCIDGKENVKAFFKKLRKKDSGKTILEKISQGNKGNSVKHVSFSKKGKARTIPSREKLQEEEKTPAKKKGGKNESDVTSPSPLLDRNLELAQINKEKLDEQAKPTMERMRKEVSDNAKKVLNEAFVCDEKEAKKLREKLLSK